MSDESLPPLGTALRKAIASARHIERADDELRARLRTRIAEAIGSASVGMPAPPEASAPADAASAADGIGSTASAVSASTVITSKIVGALLVGLTIGGTGGVVVGRMTVEPTLVRVEVPAFEPPSQLETPSVEEEVAPPFEMEPDLSPPGEATPPPLPSIVDAPRASTVRRVTETDLEAEQMLIDAARAALARENPAQARELLARHRAQFPSGALREEREGLEVLGLLRTDPERARRAAARFARRYPESLLWPAIERALPRDSSGPADTP